MTEHEDEIERLRRQHAAAREMFERDLARGFRERLEPWLIEAETNLEQRATVLDLAWLGGEAGATRRLVAGLFLDPDLDHRLERLEERVAAAIEARLTRLQEEEDG